MKPSELRKKTAVALEKQADSLREKIVLKKKAVLAGEERNHQSVAKLKKQLALVLTIATEIKTKKAEEK